MALICGWSSDQSADAAAQLGWILTNIHFSLDSKLTNKRATKFLFRLRKHLGHFLFLFIISFQRLSKKTNKTLFKGKWFLVVDCIILNTKSHFKWLVGLFFIPSRPMTLHLMSVIHRVNSNAHIILYFSIKEHAVHSFMSIKADVSDPGSFCWPRPEHPLPGDWTE